jgi:Ran GTPase-activating protein (RanGAP) involved in mRNA processing and transport
MATFIPKMRSIKTLILNDCHLSDRGVRAILEKLEDTTALDVLDLSGNQIGQSSYFKDCAAALCSYLQKSTQLNELILNHNMLRGPFGYQVLETISHHSTLSLLSLNNNFLGQQGTCIEPPATLLGRMLQTSVLLEKLDLSFN